VGLYFSQGYVLLVVLFLVWSLYREWFNPALTFFIATVALLLGRIITPGDLLQGLANEQIIVIFLLMLVTAGIRIIFGSDAFSRLFSTRLSARGFLLRMMLTVSSISSILNNTPIVAFMIPYVKDWARKTGHPVSKFLIPLSFATILGGMITVIGTSTNLVLSGLIQQYHLPMLGFGDFFYLGIIVTVTGGFFLYYFGYRLLPSNPNEIDALRENLKEYIIETEIGKGSTLVGKTVKEAGLRNLQDVFLVEIIRDDRVISPVAPDEVLEAKDALFFSGHTQSIYELIKEDNGLSVPEEQIDEQEEQFNFVEAVIPANSELIGVRIRDSDFRKKYNASIIAIHRNGKRVPGKVGEMHLAGGDFLLLLAGDHRENGHDGKDLFFLSVPKKVKAPKNKNLRVIGFVTVALLIAGVVGKLPLFTACLVILSGLVFFGVLGLSEIRRELDLSLLLILVCSLSVGVALERSGAAHSIGNLLVSSLHRFGPVGAMSGLFVVTILLTSLITHAAAVSIMFPIAMAVAQQMGLPYTPFFVAIAFAASGNFMTPISYQTNLMVYGPGGYTFRDFLRVGTPLTIMYSILSIVFISYFYNLV
jgi:di/tricarboxylate transporter